MRSILHVLNGEQYAGIERVVDILAGASPAFGYRVHLALLKSSQMMQSMEAPTDYSMVTMKNRLDLLTFRRIAAVAKERRCELIHSHTVRSAVVASPASRLAGVRWVHHIHSPALWDCSHRRRNLANFLAECALVRRADQVVVVSEYLADYAIRYYGVSPDRILVVRNGVADSSFQRETAASGRRTVSVVGAFRPRKGVETLIAAVGLLQHEFPDLTLRLIGPFTEAAYEVLIRSQVSTLGLTDHVEFVGLKQDVREELRRCDVFAFPSLYGEGTPMALLEAMAEGCAIVATRIRGVENILTEETGLLVEPGRAPPLADAIARCLTDPDSAAMLGRRAQKRQVEQFSVLSMCNRVFDMYRVMGRDTPRTLTDVPRSGIRGLF